MSLNHLTASATGSEIAAEIRRNGAVVVDRVASDEMLDAFFTEMAPHVDATPMGADDFAGRDTRRTGGLLARSATAQQMVTHPLVLATVDDLLGHVSNYQLHLTQIIAIGPGNPAQMIHRDQWAFDFFPFPLGYEVQCNTIWAGDDFTVENGATRIVPGSNHLEDGLKFTVDDTVAAEMERGSILFYNGAVYHGGGENRSDTVRRAANITYNVSWLRQEENQYLTIPRDVARTFPEDLQRLVGYQRGAYALGYVDDVRDPIDVLRDPGAAPGPSGFGSDALQMARPRPSQ